MKKSDQNRHPFFIRALVLTAILLSVICLCSCGAKRIRYSHEAGDPFPTAEELTGQAGAVYLSETDALRAPGKYVIKAAADKKTYKIVVKVKDTKAPEATMKHLFVGVGATVPRAQDFIDTLKDGSEVTASYAEEPHIVALGDYPLTVILRDALGHESRYDVMLSVILDTEAPKITAEDITVYVGDAVPYRKNVRVSDNCGDENVTLDVDSSLVDVNLVGTYTVTYTATDLSGNVSQARGKVHVRGLDITEAMLWEKIDAVIASRFSSSMSKEDMVKAVYDYVQSMAGYQTSSAKDDWVREAYTVLFVTHSGDCFSFYAASKAFFVRLGIEHLDVQRSVSIQGETHFWSMVNIGTKQDPKWYHYDSCPMTQEYRIVTYLLTDAQLSAYNKWRGKGYYTYDSSRYPASEKKILVPDSRLNPYY